MSIRVTFGANSMTLAGQSGRTIGDIRRDAEGLLGLAGNEAAQLGGQPVPDDFQVSEGASVEFVKVAGSKG